MMLESAMWIGSAVVVALLLIVVVVALVASRSPAKESDEDEYGI